MVVTNVANVKQWRDKHREQYNKNAREYRKKQRDWNNVSKLYRLSFNC